MYVHISTVVLKHTKQEFNQFPLLECTQLAMQKYAQADYSKRTKAT